MRLNQCSHFKFRVRIVLEVGLLCYLCNVDCVVCAVFCVHLLSYADFIYRTVPTRVPPSPTHHRPIPSSCNAAHPGHCRTNVQPVPIHPHQRARHTHPTSVPEQPHPIHHSGRATPYQNPSRYHNRVDSGSSSSTREIR